MNLVPIIYTSLILFFGVMMIVVTISYLTFKTKSKINPVIAEEINKYQKKVIVIRQNQYNLHQSVVPIQNNNTYRQTNNYQGASPKVNPEQVLPSNYLRSSISERSTGNYRRTSQGEDIQFRQREFEPTLNSSKNKKYTGTRIEIIKELKKIQPTKAERKHDEYKKNHSDLYEYNMLSFYSDYPERELNNLTAAHSKAV